MSTASELPQPPAGTVLKHIALGHGIQNYSCAGVSSPGAIVAPTAKGALAVLYDVTPLYPGQGPDSLATVAQFQTLVTNVLWSTKVPLNMNTSTSGRVMPSALGADLNNPFPDPAPLELPQMRPIDFLGHHFFDIGSVPRFAVKDGLLVGNKTATVAAPKSSDPGPDETGAVAWLQLASLPGSQAITYVYRVTTAGGIGHNCTAVGLDSVPYAAMYWMFGPE
jgi:Protein of unknown function (DUF3455)